MQISIIISSVSLREAHIKNIFYNVSKYVSKFYSAPFGTVRPRTLYSLTEMAIAALFVLEPHLCGLQTQGRPAIAYFLFSAKIYYC